MEGAPRRNAPFARLATPNGTMILCTVVFVGAHAAEWSLIAVAAQLGGVLAAGAV